MHIFSEKCTVTVHFRDKTHDILLTLSCTHKKIRGQTNFNERLPHALPRQQYEGQLWSCFPSCFRKPMASGNGTYGTSHHWIQPRGKLPTDLSLSFQHIHFGRCSENDGLLHVVDLDANSWRPIFQCGNCWMWSPQNSADGASIMQCSVMKCWRSRKTIWNKCNRQCPMFKNHKRGYNE